MLDSTDYIEPGDRPAAWAALAREYAARNWTRDEIAYALCVDEPTVDRLLAAGGAAQQEATTHVQ
jgi:DNA-binding transcriptional regulator LsrR (DeoR family)